MKTKLTTLATLICLFLIFWGSADASAQTTTESNEPCVSMKYDGFVTPLDAPATISKQRLEDDIIMIKTYHHALPLNGQIGLPSMEEVKDILLEEVHEQLNITIDLRLFTSMDDEKNSLTAHLIKEDWDGSHNG